jgi:phosphodiesterase/alkaline phosphatase D-like protein
VQLTAPAPPTATAAGSIASTSFNANWSASAGATAYRLDVATDTLFTSILPSYNNLNVGNVVTAAVNGLSPSTQYFYRIRGTNGTLTGDNSNVISLTTLPTAPGHADGDCGNTDHHDKLHRELDSSRRVDGIPA